MTSKANLKPRHLAIAIMLSLALFALAGSAAAACQPSNYENCEDSWITVAPGASAVFHNCYLSASPLPPNPSTQPVFVTEVSGSASVLGNGISCSASPSTITEPFSGCLTVTCSVSPAISAGWYGRSFYLALGATGLTTQINTGGMATLTLVAPTATPTPTPVPSGYACTDSDGGINYNVAGTVTRTLNGAFDSSANDICGNGNSVWDFYCSGTSIASASYVCPNGCSNGACVSSTPTSTPSPTPTPTSTSTPAPTPPGVACNHAPTMEINEVSSSPIAPGTEKEYAVFVTNNNPAGCSNSVYTVTVINNGGATYVNAIPSCAGCSQSLAAGVKAQVVKALVKADDTAAHIFTLQASDATYPLVITGSKTYQASNGASTPVPTATPEPGTTPEPNHCDLPTFTPYGGTGNDATVPAAAVNTGEELRGRLYSSGKSIMRASAAILLTANQLELQDVSSGGQYSWAQRGCQDGTGSCYEIVSISAGAPVAYKSLAYCADGREITSLGSSGATCSAMPALAGARIVSNRQVELFYQQGYSAQCAANSDIAQLSMSRADGAYDALGEYYDSNSGNVDALNVKDLSALSTPLGGRTDAVFRKK